MLAGNDSSFRRQTQNPNQQMKKHRSPVSTLAILAAFLAVAPLVRAAQFSVHLVDTTGPTIDGLVNTATDTFRINSWGNAPSATTWTPTLNQFPLTLCALSDSATSFDVPDNWNGSISSWAFVLPPGQSITTVQWQQGIPSGSFADVSFGWGGYRWGTSVGHIGDFPHNTLFAYVPLSDSGLTDPEFDIVNITPVPEPSASMLALISGLLAWIFIRRRHGHA
jgi:hypothetical protein